MPSFPHLTDRESVRAEAEQQYGGLSDAAAFVQHHQASLDPDVEAASLRKVNEEATAEVKDDLSIAQDLVDESYGGDKYRVIDAAVRGDALSVIAEDEYGRPQHLVVGYTERWRSIKPPDADARANALAEKAKAVLGAEAREEVERRVAEATSKIMSDVGKLVEDKLKEVEDARVAAQQDAADEPEADEDADEPESSESNRGGDGEADGSDGGDADGSDATEAPKYPRTHDDLDALAKASKVEFADGDNVETKQEKLRAAGVAPPEKE